MGTRGGAVAGGWVQIRPATEADGDGRARSSTAWWAPGARMPRLCLPR
uniref:Uncharacterized protein n=1 Tax=Arundo donax TaxID=35708 RepID=A0A0A9FRA9_ARUDO